MIGVEIGLCTLGEARARHVLAELMLMAGVVPAAGSPAVTISYGYLKRADAAPRVIIPYESTHVAREIPPDVYADGGVQVPALFLSPPPQGEVLLKTRGGHPLLTRVGKTVYFGFDVVSGADYFLNARGEIGWPRDDHDRPAITGAPSWRGEVLGIAAANRYASLVGRALDVVCREAGLPTVRFRLWPAGVSFGLALSHDVDRLRAPGRREVLRDWARRLRGKGATRHPWTAFLAGAVPYQTLEAIAAAEEGVEGRATFFVGAVRRGPLDFSYRLDEASSLLGELGRRGYEVGLHASYYSREDSARLQEEKRALEAARGDTVAGVRGHYLRLAGEPGWSAVARAGFEYEASTGYASHAGWRTGANTPYRPFNAAAGAPYDFVSVPLAVMDGTLFQYRRYDAGQAGEAASALLDEAAATGGVYSVLWHYRSFPGGMFPAWGEVLARLVRAARERGAAPFSHNAIVRRYRMLAALRAVWSPVAKSLTLTNPLPSGEELDFVVSEGWLAIPGEGAKPADTGFTVAGHSSTASVVFKNRKY